MSAHTTKTCRGPRCLDAPYGGCPCPCHDATDDTGSDDPPSGRLEDAYDSPDGSE